MFSLENSSFTPKRLNRVDAEFAGHPDHIIKTATNDRHSQPQRWLRLNDLLTRSGMGFNRVFIDKLCLPKLATPIGNRQRISDSQAKNPSEVVGFIVLEFDQL